LQSGKAVFIYEDPGVPPIPPPVLCNTSSSHSVIYAEIFAATLSFERTSLLGSLSKGLTGSLEPRGQKPGEEGRIVSIVHVSGILICKRAGENFGLVFNELRVFGGFRALDNLGLRAGSTLGFDLA
jgi:hypothetical protein